MNIEKIRQDTKGLKGKTFLNSAGSSLMPASVPAKMTEYLSLEEEWGGYMVEMQRAEDISSFYTESAKMLNCKPSNMAFAFNATDAYVKAVSSLALKAGDNILISDDDYVSSFISLLSLRKKTGINILRAKNLPNGDLDLEDFERKARQHHPKLVSLAHIPTNSGLVQDAEAVGKICLSLDIFYLLDACQSVGQIPVDTSKIGCDFLSAAGRKFLRGPRGTGFLFVSDKVLEMGLEPMGIDTKGAEQTGADEYIPLKTARRFELFEISYASLLGLTEAISYANATGLENIETYNRALATRLRSRLSEIPGVEVLDMGSRLCSIITFHIEGLELEKIEERLNNEKVIYSVSRKKNAFIDMDKKRLEWVVRFSPHYFNTQEEVDSAADIIASIGRLRA